MAKKKKEEKPGDEPKKEPDAEPKANKAPSRAATKAAPKSGGALCLLDSVPNAVLGPVDAGLSGARRVLSRDLFEGGSRWLTRLGLFAIVVAAAAGLIASLVQIKDGGIARLGVAVAWVVACGVLVYVAKRFLGAGETLIAGAPTKLASPAFLDCVALLTVLGGIVALLGGAYMAITVKALDQLLSGVVVFIVCEVIACIAMNPSMICVDVEAGASTGEEAIGVLSFFVKALVKMVPLVFGIATIGGAVILIVSIFQSFGEHVAGMPFRSYQGMQITFLAGLLPLAAYLVFLTYNLTIELMRAVLVVPAKLDRLAKKK